MIPFRFSNRVIAAVLGLLAIGYLVIALQMPDFTAVQVPVQPSTLPRWLGVTLVILAVLLFFQKEQPAGDGDSSEDSAGGDTPGGDAAANTGTDSSGQGAADDGTARAGASSQATETGARLGRLSDPRLELALFAGSAAVYIALITPLGFLLSTVLYTSLTTWYLGYRRHVVNLVVSVAAASALYFGMTEGLNVVLPSGPFPF